MAVEHTLLRSFYEKYKTLRRELLNHLLLYNPTLPPPLLITKAEKLLQRLVLLCICMITQRIPGDTFKKLTATVQPGDQKETQLLWTNIKDFFHQLSAGNTPFYLPLFTDGLLAEDHELSALIINDLPLLNIMNQLSTHFSRNPGYWQKINVLGFLFEQSITDLEALKGQQGSTNKRKQTGVFYTPEHITHHLLQETIGAWLAERKQEASQNPSARGWENYKKALAHIQVLDPACGSGAFLIQALDYLNHENQQSATHRHAQDSHKGSPDTEETLQPSFFYKNIYGVDIDPESVEITKLSLWLSGTGKKEDLAVLDHHIQCGNALIDDPVLAGKDAFDWYAHFPQLFYGGIKPSTASSKTSEKQVSPPAGFDVILGNPPWVFARGGNFDQKTKAYYYHHYKLARFQINTYALFIERSFQLLRAGGYLGFIIPNTWLTIDCFSPLRKFLLENTGDIKIINIFRRVFKQAQVDCCLLVFKKTPNNRITLGEIKESSNPYISWLGHFTKQQLQAPRFIIHFSYFKNPLIQGIIAKVKCNSSPLKEWARVSTGVKVYQTGKGHPPQTDKIKKKRTFHTSQCLNETYKKYLAGRDVGRYALFWSGEWVAYGDWLAEPRKSIDFSAPRILVRQIPASPPYCIRAMYTDQEYINDINSMVVSDCRISPLFILACLNSKLTSFWFIHTFDKLQRAVFPQFKVHELADFPICLPSPEQHLQLMKKAEHILSLNHHYHPDSCPVKPPLSTDISPGQMILKQFKAIDEDINKLIYQIYGLTESEIAVLEAGWC